MKNLAKDAVLFATLLAVYFAGRLALLAGFNANGATPSPDWFGMSLRFDTMTAAYIILPTFALTLLGLAAGKRDFAAKTKVRYAALATVVSALIAVINVCFFREYKSQFNYWVFGILFDDRHAILASIWKAYPVLTIFFGTIGVSLGALFGFGKIFTLIDKSKIETGWKTNIAATAFALCIIVPAMRGWRADGLRMRDVAVERSDFLNALIPSSAYCLQNEISRFAKSALAVGLSEFNATEADIPAFLREIFGAENFDAALCRRAKGSPLKSLPKRIFLFVGESHSAWPTYDKFSEYAIMPETRALYGKSLFCQRALSSGGGTMASLSSLISGIPYTGLDVRGIRPSRNDCAPAAILKRLGYTSTFFSAGTTSWMQIGDFAKFNGFDNAVGGDSMGGHYSEAEWGVCDAELVDFLLKTDFPPYSFNMFLSVSNHPPYDIDLKAEGCPRELKNDDEVRMYHMWYADREIGRFVRAITEKYPDSLVIITGDHPSRNFPPNASYAEKSAVPVIFTGKAIADAGLANREYKVAQHLDIIPTLVELLAPKGFEYKAWTFPLGGRKTPAVNPLCAETDADIFALDSPQCPRKLANYTRKYLALAYYFAESEPRKKQEKR